ncbi:5-methyltetrahydropteroyltriglutamate--homocysteine S-methyltransferase, partial [Xanthomonas citri pv. citri]|nr:5-methyltetrahydropteroyltriglutamate--homocysteine S-methyltransferase [Xanthomonas citri pv. citri]
REAKAAGHQVKPVIVGPLTFLWLGKEKGEAFNRFDLLKQLVPIYFEILTALAAEGVEWIQIDEPALALDLPQEWLAAYQDVYAQLAKV